MKRLAIALLCLGLNGGVVLAQDNPGAESVIPAPAQQPANLKEKASYLLGFDFVQTDVYLSYVPFSHVQE